MRCEELQKVFITECIYEKCIIVRFSFMVGLH